MEVFVRDYKGRRFTLKCESDDTIGILLHQYSALSGESIDGNVYKFVVEGMGSEEVEEKLSDLGICHESSLRIGLQKRLVEFKVIDFNALMVNRNHSSLRNRDVEDGRLYDEKLNLIKKYGTDAEKTHWDDLVMSHRSQHLHLPMRIYPFLLSEEVNNGWEIVDINYQIRPHGHDTATDMYPKVIFKRVM
jgi:hypothetical protein